MYTMVRAQLLILDGPPDYLDQVFMLSGKHTRLLGRSNVCNFQIRDSHISSIHCYFIYKNDHFYIYDLLSSNGVCVNDVLVDFAELHEKDKISIGQSILEFSLFHGNEQGKTYISGDKPNLSIQKSENFEEHNNEEQVKMTLVSQIHDPQDIIICRFALKNGFITHDKIRKFIENKDNESTTIAQYFVQNNLLTEQQIHNLIQENTYYKARNKDINFAKIAIASNFASEDDVQNALEEQAFLFNTTHETKRLGTLLIDKNILTVHQNNIIVKHLQSLPH